MNRKQEYILKSGRAVHIIDITQYFTYEGLLEGVPTKEMNKGIINEAIAKAKAKSKAMPFLIEPVEVPINIERKYPFGTPASIPQITCIATLNSHLVARDKSMDASMLQIVWFQLDFAFPIEDEILQKIAAIDWEKHASDYEY